MLRRLDEPLDLSLSVRTEVAGQSLEANTPDYPIAALRQLTRNAIMHRSYEGTQAPVCVHGYNHRVEITSPGGLYGKMTAQNSGPGNTDYRNTLVAEIMHHLGYAQRFGLGIPLARKTLRKNGNPEPEFGPTHVAVTVKARL